MRYDALLLVSFGGPEKPEDVMPFLRNVVRGRDVPEERLLEVAEHYHHLGGKSPINDHARALLAAIRAELAARGPTLPVYWGNRNWHPLLVDTIRQMKSDGVQRALAFVTSAYGSYNGCRQYREDIEAARAEVGDAPEVHKLRAFFDHPGFVEPMVDHVRRLDAHDARLVFTAHSIPVPMADGSPYVRQLQETARLVAERLGVTDYDLVWQSRSGPPRVPWLGPDIGDHLRALGGRGVTDVVVVPLGFTSDHVEVVWDLDHEARAAADAAGVRMLRASTVGTDPRFVTMIRELIEERVAGAEARSLSPLGPAPDHCAPGCCPAPPRRPQPA